MAEADLLKALSRGEYEWHIHPIIAFTVVLALISTVWQIRILIKRNAQNKKNNNKTVWGLNCNAKIVDE